jgi:hypothetical protein
MNAKADWSQNAMPGGSPTITTFLRRPIVLGSLAGLWGVTLVIWALGFGAWSDPDARHTVLLGVVLTAMQCYAGTAIGWRLASAGKRVVSAYIAAGLLLIALALLVPLVVDYAMGVADQSSIARRLYAFPRYFSTQLVFAAIGHYGRRGLAVQHVRLASAELAAELTLTRSQSFQARLQPDFVLKSLRAISDRIPADPGEADLMLLDVSELMRLSICRLSTMSVSLGTEVDFMTAYFAMTAKIDGTAGIMRSEVPAAVRGILVPSGSVSLLFNCLHAWRPSIFGDEVTVLATAGPSQLQIFLSASHAPGERTTAAEIRGGEWTILPGAGGHGVSVYASRGARDCVRMDVPLDNECGDEHGSQP